jgi:hypothetical protein
MLILNGCAVLTVTCPGCGRVLTKRAQEMARDVPRESSRPRMELGLHKPGKQDFAADWQRLMQLWETAFASYTVVCGGRIPPTSRNTAQPVGGDVEEARLNLIRIKHEIDELISACGRTRAASLDPPRFALLDAQTKRTVDKTPARRSASSDQVATKSNKP